MKILIITEKYPPIVCSGNRIYNLVKHLSKNNEISVMCRENNRWLFPMPEDRTIPMLKNVKLIKFKIYDSLLLIPTMILFKLKLISNSKFYYKQIKNKIKNNKELFKDIDLVIASGPSWDVFKGAEYLFDTYDIPFILDYRDPWISRTKRELNIQKRIINKAKDVVTVTESFAKQIEKINNYSKKINIIENGVDLNNIKFNLKKKQDKKLNIGYAGSLIEYQNVNKLCYAIYKLPKNIKKNITLNIYGEDLFNKYKKLSKKLKIKINLNGFLNNNKLIEKLNECDLFYIGHSINNSISGKFYVYLSLNKPILLFTNKSSQLNTILKKHKLGFINYNIEELSKTIEKIYKNRKLLNENNFEIKKYIKNYDWKILAKKYEKIIKFILK